MKSFQKIFAIIVLMLQLGCDLHLNEPSFQIYLNNTNKPLVEILSPENIRLSWEYNAEGTPDVSFMVNHFASDTLVADMQIEDYTLLNTLLITEIESEPVPGIDEGHIFRYSSEITGLEYGKYHYFMISVELDEVESIDNGEISFRYIIANATIERRDCEYPLSNEFAFCLTAIRPADSLFSAFPIPADVNLIIEITESQSGESILIHEFPTNFDQNTSLQIDISPNLITTGNEWEINDYAAVRFEYEDIVPGNNYNIKFLLNGSNQSGDPVVSDETVASFEPMMPVINTYFREYSRDGVRLKFDPIDILEQYDSLRIFWGSSPQSVMTTTASTAGLSELNNYKYYDLSNVDNMDSCSLVFFNDYGYYCSGEILTLETLDPTLPGYVLVEIDNRYRDLTNDLSTEDFYISKYELTNLSSLTGENNQNPVELGRDSLINQIFQNDGHSFRLPNDIEWRYAAGWDHQIHNFLDYPWGNEIEPYHANFLNSEYPVGSNGITPTGFHPYSSPSGLYDCIGNVQEWVLLATHQDSLVLKGGSYNTPVNDLNLDDYLAYISDVSIAGIRLILVTNDGE